MAPFRSRAHQPQAGFTLTELMLIVVLIAILSGISIAIVPSSWRRERLNAAVTEFAGWLEEISRNTERNGTSCVVTLTTPLPLTLAPGGVMATVSPSSCSSNPSFRVPSTFGATSFSVNASNTTWTYTPRGAITSSADIQVRLAFSGSNPVRCVNVSGTLGLIRLGRNDSATSSSTACTVFGSI
jgi:Tfp pilus assembly protein PilE